MEAPILHQLKEFYESLTPEDKDILEKIALRDSGFQMGLLVILKEERISTLHNRVQHLYNRLKRNHKLARRLENKEFVQQISAYAYNHMPKAARRDLMAKFPQLEHLVDNEKRVYCV
ncbi:hypothetical protein L596_023260 [Steinernema carpocapsae]|uniref:Uncharacterized protein n=1 Tax=Steinernema carpocapsae TaxID=34508 RepID=A0A4U5MD44_STECR|nr:hypothetical protein L596_023260 [Steinernema carpocapsae]